MTVEQILKLIEAGYTKAEIENFSKENENVSENENEMKNEKVSENVSETREETKHVENVPILENATPRGDEYKALLAAIEKLTGAVISQNINKEEIPGTFHNRTDEDIITQIIKGQEEK